MPAVITGKRWRMRTLIHLALVVVLGGLIYSNTMQVPLVFDDEFNLQIEQNRSLADWRCFTDADYAEQLISKGLLPQNFPTRAVTFLTFALNYQLLADNLVGYHLVNLAIHLLNGILVYSLVRLTMQTPFWKGACGGGSQETTATLAALLFVSHPVQTEAVTYLSQRFTSLATLFYLLSLVSYIGWRLGVEPSGAPARKSAVWRFFGRRPGIYVLALFSAMLAMKTKEISFTLPLMICLYEYSFFPEVQGKRRLFLLPFLLTLLIVPLIVFGQKADYVDIANLKDSLHGVGPGNATLYLFTQFRVVVTYLRLLVLPVNQNFDYAYPLAAGFFNLPTMASFLFLVAIAGLGVYLFVRSARSGEQQAFALRLAAFGIFWFFLALSVESTIVPLLDVIFEHRLYLPSVGFFLVLSALFVAASARLGPVGGRILTTAVVILILGWAGATYARNTVWRVPLTMYQDVVRKSPGKSRGHYALGVLYQDAGRDADAVIEYKEAIRLEPTSPDALLKLAEIYHEHGDNAAALSVLEEAGRYQDASDDPQFYSALGVLYMQADRLAEAERALRLAISRDPHPDLPLRNLGEVYRRQRRLPEAVAAFESALKFDPGNSEIRTALAAVRAETGRSR